MGKKWYNLFVSVDDPAQPGGHDSSPNAAQAIADIAASIAPEAQFTRPISDPTSFDEIYNAAEIHPPAHGFTIGKVGEMLNSEYIRNLPKDVKKSSILVALEASGAQIQEVIEDAVKRDRALDTFERVQQQSVDDLEARKTKENQQIQAEIDRLVTEHRSRMQANSDEVAKAKERFFGWRLKKQEEEQKIADAVSYFVVDNPITIGAPAASPVPPHDSKN